MRNKKLLALLLVVAIGVIVLAYFGWSSIQRKAAVQQHIADMEMAWQRYSQPPHASEHQQNFVYHRNELLRLGHLRQREFELPVKLGTEQGKELIKALIERSGSRPMCEWSPRPTTTLVTVYASEQEMPQWEAMLDRWKDPR